MGYTDIVSIPQIGKIIMMIGNNGDIISIEISEMDKEALIDYTIHQITDNQMIEALNGLTKYDKKTNTATGEINTKKENVIKEIYSIISKCPINTTNDFEEEVIIDKQCFNEEDVKKLVETRRVGKIKVIIDYLKNNLFNKKRKDTKNDEQSKDE